MRMSATSPSFGDDGSPAQQRALHIEEIISKTQPDLDRANLNALSTTRLATRASKQWMTIEQSAQDIDKVRPTLEETKDIVASIKNRLNRASAVLNEVAPPDDPRDEHKSAAA